MNKDLFSAFRSYAGRAEQSRGKSFRSSVIDPNVNVANAKKYLERFSDSFAMIKSLLEESTSGEELNRLYSADCIAKTANLEMLGVEFRFEFRFSNMEESPDDCRICFVPKGDL